MTLPRSMSTNEIAAAMQQGGIQSLTKFVVARNLTSQDNSTIQSVLAALPDDANRLKMALFYLEYAQWDLHLALLHIELDTADREDVWIVEASNDNSPGVIQDNNIELNRDMIERGDQFNKALLEITYKTKFNASVTVSFPDDIARKIDTSNQAAIDDLNRWRRSTIWRLIGPDIGLSYSQGEKWHPLQETFVKNRFAFSENARPDFKGIHQDYVAMFDGVLLPGRAVKCGPRSQVGITSYLHRHSIDVVDGTGMSQSLTRDLKHSMVRQRLQEEWRQKVEAVDGKTK